uniref:Uncharacterized protein n=1 Tax=Physcomitrium patens TaxID=3218 RepID=A0A2K1KPR4_PHYPA|nr:hypothetical protein PHYPA_006633 [Physcomitrium patens]
MHAICPQWTKFRTCVESLLHAQGKVSSVFLKRRPCSSTVRFEGSCAEARCVCALLREEQGGLSERARERDGFKEGLSVLCQTRWGGSVTLSLATDLQSSSWRSRLYMGCHLVLNELQLSW